jgi:UDP-2,3-diacylglucosamine hydrolase
MAIYFISDVHLGLGSRQEEREKEDRLLAFFRTIRPDTNRLFILGDLFDFWFEYATVIPKGFHRTLTALQDFTDRGIPVHYLAGNHDFWMGGYLREEIGVQLHAEPFEAQVDNKRVFLHHGDGLAQNDLGYRLIKPVLRNRLAVRMYRLLHPDLGIRLARGSSRTSRAYTSHKDFGEEKGMLAFAEHQIQKGVDIVVMGHRHVPERISIGHGVYVNLGDWITFNTYGKLTDGVMHLETWSGQQESAR